MSDIAARLLERLTESDHGHTFPAMRPRDAATMIIIDRATPAPQVLLGRRHHGHKFMPGKFVFPGGRVEPIDRRMPSATSIEPRVEARLMQLMPRASAAKARGLMHVRRGASPARARGLFPAAIRETFEKTGLLLGTQSREPVRSPGGLWD